MTLSIKFINEVKQVLDNGNWAYEASEIRNLGPRFYETAEKAVSYLNNLNIKFSANLVEFTLRNSEWPEDFGSCNSHKEAINKLASYIAYDIATSRVACYNWSFLNSVMFTFEAI